MGERMNIGITGSRKEPTEKQQQVLKEKLKEVCPDWIHHGDCLGADRMAHDIAVRFGIKTHIHPPTNGKYRAFCKGDQKEKRYDYLVRDQNIVNRSEMLIAIPSHPETLRSGTWATVRRARKKGIEIHIIWTDGNITIEGEQDEQS